MAIKPALEDRFQYSAKLSTLHYTIIRFIIDHGFAPDAEEISNILKTSKDNVQEMLVQLEEYHGVVLHPQSSKILYSRHLDSNWNKWTIEIVKNIFERLQLEGITW